MTNKPRNKGTVGENEIVALLYEYGLKDAKRTSAGMESHDIWLGDITVEVKYRKRWVLFAIHGDRRSTVGKTVGRVAVFDADFAAELLMLWRHWQEKDTYL